MKLTNKIISHIADPLKSFKALQRIIATICILIPLILRTCDKDDFNPIEVGATALTHISDCRDSNSIKVDTYIKHYFIKGHQVDSETRWIITDCRSNDTIINAAKINKHRWGFRASVSNYAYSSNSYLFGMLYCMAAMLFIYNGVTHIKIFKNKDRFQYTNLNARGCWCYISIGVSLIMVILNPMHGRQILHYIFAILFFVLNIYAIAFLPNKDVSKNGKLKRYVTALIAAIALILSLIFKAILWGEWISLAIISSHLFLVSNSVQLKLHPGQK